MLGLFALLSPLRVTRDRKQCKGCGVCSGVCPSHIRVMEKERVISEECIGCWRCISHCRETGALEMKPAGRKAAISGLLFALLVVGLFWGGTMIGRATGHWHTAITIGDYARLLGP